MCHASTGLGVKKTPPAKFTTSCAKDGGAKKMRRAKATMYAMGLEAKKMEPAKFAM